jgi:hypothetical protein
MRTVGKWVIGIGAVALAVSLYFNSQQAKVNRQFRADANEDLALGLGAIYDTGISLKEDNRTIPVTAWEGIGRLQSAEQALPSIKGIGGLVRYFENALDSMSVKNATLTADAQHYVHVMVTSRQSMMILSSDYRYMTDQQLQKAVDVIYQMMTPQERNQYESIG